MSSTMRVVHLFRGFHDYVREIVNSEAELAEIHLFVTRRDVPILDGLKQEVRVHLTECPRVRSPRNLLYLARMASRIRELKPDVVHMQSGLIWEYGAMMGRHEFPVVLTVHDVVNHPAFGWQIWRTPEWITAWAARHADAVIVHGDSLKGLIRERAERRKSWPRVYSVDHGVISRYGTGSARCHAPAGTGNVLFFGYLQKNKGLEYLVEAYAILRQSVAALSMIVAGDTGQPDYYKGLCGREPGISLRLGHQDDGSVEKLFRWADVLVLPYIETSQSGVCQIATAFAVPVVATLVGGLPDVIRHGHNGLLVPPRDPARLADAIRELLTDAALRSEVIRNLQADRDGRFSWRRIASQTIDIYQQAIDRFHGRPEAHSATVCQAGNARP